MSDNQSFGLSVDRSAEPSTALLGFDNVLFPVGDLGEAVGFYERAGFPVALRLDELGLAILKVGKETPGVLLRVEDGILPRTPVWPSPRFWLEVPDARAKGRALTDAGVVLLAEPFSVATGWTVEIADPWGNVIGFTDYLKRPELARTP
ncbi:VOC family protein [Streptomyces alfalfae]|uniref:Extradiol dioxygenase n=1 Tax=Streptomyces alfalfae TaxID=1642299 RepID=A0A1P8TGI8_9ACTN|nr:VOC family protein [Streptomyces alfalfae]AYA17138.1 VOC family protein [Streptomyces fradiae]APY86750.1 extradiol dioxygenase [Streptomyces alfalfae]QQC90994.1 VOC family protein [Streptomyces alfalfae]QUI33482.1 VOC family protein [Streptomyces alfalfae]RXX37862.1 VOC family protein [Streptomyces alfalfae]